MTAAEIDEKDIEELKRALLLVGADRFQEMVEILAEKEGKQEEGE